MKTIKLIPLLAIVLFLAGCGTAQQKYEKVQRSCNMSWYVVSQSPYWKPVSFRCMHEMDVRKHHFEDCARFCDVAIDDYRDVWHMTDNTIACLELCMWE